MEYSRIAPIMGRLWSPIAAVTSHWQGKSNAQIAVAIAAASIVPDMPRVLLQIYKTNYSHDLIYNSGSFALNFLRQDQLELINDFGLVSGRDRDKLLGAAHAPRATGSPVLDDCWGFLDCRVVNAMDGGDMTCFLGDVLDGETLSKPSRCTGGMPAGRFRLLGTRSGTERSAERSRSPNGACPTSTSSHGSPKRKRFDSD